MLSPRRGCLPRSSTLRASSLLCGAFFGCGGFRSKCPSKSSEAEQFSSAPISRAFSLNALDCALSAGFIGRPLGFFIVLSSLPNTAIGGTRQNKPQLCILRRQRKIRQTNNLDLRATGNAPDISIIGVNGRCAINLPSYYCRSNLTFAHVALLVPPLPLAARQIISCHRRRLDCGARIE